MKESDFDPIAKNGELQIPAHGYKDGKQLIIEDQRGEIMRRIPRIPDESDQASIISTGTIGSIRPAIQTIKRTLSRIGSRVGDVEPEPIEEKKNENIHSVLYGDDASPINPLRRVVKTVLPRKEETSEKGGTIRDRLSGALSNKRKGRKLHISEKLHGFRLNDTIIIEDSDGNIVATYKINPKALHAEKIPSLGGKIFQHLGMAKKNGINDDEEANLKSNATLIPENDTIDDSRLESKIRAFMENPNKVRITRKDAREAARARLRRHLKEIDKEIRESGNDDGDQNEVDDNFEYYEDGDTGGETDDASANEKDENKERAQENSENSASTGSSKDQNEDDREERLTRDLIEKQKAEGQARRRRREGSMTRRMRASKKADKN